MQAYALKESQFQGVFEYKADENKRDLKRWRLAINEIRIQCKLRHPNIVLYKDSFFDQENESLCLVMELMNGGTLE